jgi:transposase
MRSTVRVLVFDAPFGFIVYWPIEWGQAWTSGGRPSTTCDGSWTPSSAGIPWPFLPHNFARWETVNGYFAAWQKDAVFDQLDGLLRSLFRGAKGRDAEPSSCVLDAQSVKTSPRWP